VGGAVPPVFLPRLASKELAASTEQARSAGPRLSEVSRRAALISLFGFVINRKRLAGSLDACSVRGEIVAVKARVTLVSRGVSARLSETTQVRRVALLARSEDGGSRVVHGVVTVKTRVALVSLSVSTRFVETAHLGWEHSELGVGVVLVVLIRGAKRLSEKLPVVGVLLVSRAKVSTAHADSKALAKLVLPTGTSLSASPGKGAVVVQVSSMSARRRARARVLAGSVNARSI